MGVGFEIGQMRLSCHFFLNLIQRYDAMHSKHYYAPCLQQETQKRTTDIMITIWTLVEYAKRYANSNVEAKIQTAIYKGTYVKRCDNKPMRRKNALDILKKASYARIYIYISSLSTASNISKYQGNKIFHNSVPPRIFRNT